MGFKPIASGLGVALALVLALAAGVSGQFNPVIFVGEAVAGAPATSVLFNTTNTLGASANFTFTDSGSAGEVDVQGLVAASGVAGIAPLVPGDNATIYGELFADGTDQGTAVRGDVNVSGTANIAGSVVSLQAFFGVTDTADVHVYNGFYFSGSKAMGATIDLLQVLWSQDIAPMGATNGYYLWFDSQGVYRIREDSTFDSVGQAITALYNPQFTKYTAGATNFERIVQQWHGNVAEYGTEAGGTGTIRDLRLLAGTALSVQNAAGTYLPVNASDFIVHSSAFKPDTTNAHTALYQAYDVNDAVYRTFGTATNANTPTFDWSAPSGGTLSGNFTTLQVGGTNVLTSLTGGTCTNQVVTALSSAGATTCTTVTSAYVNSSIGLTGSALSQFAATTSAQLAGVISDETGSGALVFATSPTLVTPALGTPSSGTLTNATGLPEGGLSLTDITTNDVSTSKHGFAPKAPNDASKSLDGTGAYSRVVYASQSFALNAVFSPADSTSYYIGIVDNARTSDTATATPHWMPGFSGTIRGYSILVLVAGATGTTENTTASVRFNDATDVTLNSAVKFSAASQTYSGTLSQSVASTDTIKIKLATPAWSTNPTNCLVTVTLYVQLTGM